MPTLFLSILACPIQDVSTRAVDKVDPYANLEWHEFDFAGLFNETDDGTDSTNDRRWDPFKEMDKIKNFVTKSACIGSGIKIESSVAAKYIPQVCSQFLRKSPYVVALDQGWEALQFFNLHDADGDRAYINFRYRTYGDDPPELTSKICQTAYERITKNVCLDDGETQGATVSIKKDEDEDNELQIGFDPNDQEEDVPMNQGFCPAG